MAAPDTLHGQLTDDLRKQITSGELGPGAKLPSEADLSSKYGISRPTVRQGLRTLELEGLIGAYPGRGRIVRQLITFDHHPSGNELPNRPKGEDGYVAEVKRAGRTPTTAFDMRIEPVPRQEIADALNISADQLVCVRQVRRYVDGVPWSAQASYYPLDLAQETGLTTTSDIPEGTVRRLAAHGYEEVGYVDAITARMPTPDEARELNTTVGTPLLVQLRRAGTTSRVVRVTETKYPADRNRLMYDLHDTSGLR